MASAAGGVKYCVTVKSCRLEGGAWGQVRT